MTEENQNKNICIQCNKEIPEADVKMYEGDDKKTPICLCDECAANIRQEFYLATQNVNIFKALFFGVGASIILGLLWYWVAVWTNTLYSIVVVALGFIIALACSFGAGNKKGPKVQIISVLLTLMTIICAEGLFVFRVAEINPFGEGIIVGIIASIVLLPLSAFTSLGVSGTIFSLIGLYVAFTVTKKDELKMIK